VLADGGSREKWLAQFFSCCLGNDNALVRRSIDSRAANATDRSIRQVNADSGVYQKPGTRWYGKTKQGKYMKEADAQKAAIAQPK